MAAILAGTAALGVIYTGCGAAIATRYDSVNAMLLPASAFVALLLLPLLPHFGLAPPTWFRLHPVEPALALIRGGYGGSIRTRWHSAWPGRWPGVPRRLRGDGIASAGRCAIRAPRGDDEGNPMACAAVRRLAVAVA